MGVQYCSRLSENECILLRFSARAPFTKEVTVIVMVGGTAAADSYRPIIVHGSKKEYSGWVRSSNVAIIMSLSHARGSFTQPQHNFSDGVATVRKRRILVKHPHVTNMTYM